MSEASPTAHCPFCQKLMKREAESWICEGQKLTFPRCPTCGNPLNGVIDLWCAECRKWFDEKLEVK